MLFGLFSVPWDFFHIGLLVVVIMILISGMVMCVSVVGVCCLHWLEEQPDPDHPPIQNVKVDRGSDKSSSGDQYHEWVDPIAIRTHFDEVERSRLERMQRMHAQPALPPEDPQPPPPPYSVLFPPAERC